MIRISISSVSSSSSRLIRLRRFLPTKELSSFCSSRSYSQDSNYSKDTKTHFGYKTVSEEEKVDKVLSVFHNVAEKYDLMNDAMSFGIHRHWKNQFVSVLNPTPGMKLLDVAGGTGDIAFRFLDYIKANNKRKKEDRSQEEEESSSHVVVCDINQSMLDVGKSRSQKLGYDPKEIEFVQGDAQALDRFSDNTFDAYTIAFGIRNVVRIEQALKEAYRVLKPGGRFMCLEFSKVDNPLLGPFYEAYSFQVIPPMGKVLAGDWDSYQYLVESIRRFPDQETFLGMISEAGFRGLTYKNLTFGVAAIHSGFKL